MLDLNFKIFTDNPKRYILLWKLNVKIEGSKIIYKFTGQAMPLNLAYQPNVVTNIDHNRLQI